MIFSFSSFSLPGSETKITGRWSSFFILLPRSANFSPGHSLLFKVAKGWMRTKEFLTPNLLSLFFVLLSISLERNKDSLGLSSMGIPSQRSDERLFSTVWSILSVL